MNDRSLVVAAACAGAAIDVLGQARATGEKLETALTESHNHSTTVV
jgi:hypothetical protein